MPTKIKEMESECYKLRNRMIEVKRNDLGNVIALVIVCRILSKLNKIKTL